MSATCTHLDSIELTLGATGHWRMRAPPAAVTLTGGSNEDIRWHPLAE